MKTNDYHARFRDYPDEDQGLLSLVSAAIETYSPSYHEAPAVDLFETEALKRSLPVRRVPVASGRDNLLIEVGPQPPALVLVGHLDTIPGSGPESARSEVRDGRQALAAVDADIRGPILTGLGSADMKSACAAMLSAAADLAAEIENGTATGPTRGFAVHLVVGEEEYGDGAEVAANALAASVKERGATPPLIIIGEPTRLRPCIRHATYCEGSLTTSGRVAHAALPGLGRNAISAMCAWVHALTGRLAETPDIVLNPRKIGGGSNEFLVPQQCTLKIDVHAPPETSEADIKHNFELAAVAAHDVAPGRRFDWRSAFYAPGYQIAEDSPALEALRHAYTNDQREWNPDTFPSHSDGPVYHARGLPTVICGPGTLDVAHTEGEFIAINQIIRARSLYRQIIRAAVRTDSRSRD